MRIIEFADRKICKGTTKVRIPEDVDRKMITPALELQPRGAETYIIGSHPGRTVIVDCYQDGVVTWSECFDATDRGKKLA